ncbi:MAG: hypothetical protein IJ740_07595 [Ruminococcus sp.]|nr:hypothetical protein [Ruminococcus sp.]
MEKEAFTLVEGVDADITGVVSAYEETDDGFELVLSGEKLLPFAKDIVAKLLEPVFFFLELPKNSDENNDEYDVYYLDNCTLPVAQAILERYGELLISDGLSRFGFGSHSNEYEVYFKDFQQVSLYFPEKEAARSVLEKHGIPECEKLKTMWDNFTESSPGLGIKVELNGETAFDIADNLKDEGMYKA